MTLVFSFDLSWLSPLLIFVGVMLFMRARIDHGIGRFGRVLIGLGLIILALQLIVLAAKPLTQAAGVKVIFASLTGDVLLDMLVGALFTMLSYSSLAVVLLTATLATSKVISLHVAMGLVLGANLGSGLLAMLNTMTSPPEARRVTLGNLLFKLIGCLIDRAAAALRRSAARRRSIGRRPDGRAISTCCSTSPSPSASCSSPSRSRALAERLLPAKPDADDPAKARYLDPSALDTPGARDRQRRARGAAPRPTSSSRC